MGILRTELAKQQEIKDAAPLTSICCISVMIATGNLSRRRRQQNVITCVLTEAVGYILLHIEPGSFRVKRVGKITLFDERLESVITEHAGWMVYHHNRALCPASDVTSGRKNRSPGAADGISCLRRRDAVTSRPCQYRCWRPDAYGKRLISETNRQYHAICS